MVDSENVGDVWVPLLAAAKAEEEVVVFYTQRSPHMNYENVRKLKETDREAVQEKLDEAVCAINDLQEEFDENDSEIETVARDCIGESVAYILAWFGIPIDVEEAIRERDW